MATQTQTFTIQGMSCAHCVRAVQQALETVDGARVETVDIGTATVTFDDAKTSADAIRQAIEEEGYPVAA